MIDRATVDRIMDAANIVEVVQEFVTLRKRGTSYKGLCPFHDDRTPSFSVSPSRGVYKCFSCGKAGNVVNFVMEHEQMTYPEALRWLAGKYHIEIKDRELTDDEKREQNERESMFIVNEWAAQYFEDILHNDVDGRAIGMQYFRMRGFRDDIIRRFHLGFALNQRSAMADAALQRGYQADYLLKTGLCYERTSGSGESATDGRADSERSHAKRDLRDRFSGRVIFPWLGMSGKVVAFGGRLLDSRTKGVAQKYVNSPDSEIYHKDHELYGIFQAKKAITKEDCVYMVEGYTDVIAMHQCGIENVVANSGTALSVHQIRLLHRFTENIVLLYDGDEAGIHAAMRGTDMLLEEGMKVKVLLLPDQEDPDSFARKHTAAEFRQHISEHQTDFIEFKTALMLKGVTDPIKRSEAINNIVSSISIINDQIIRANYIQLCSQRTGIAEATLITTMNDMIRKRRQAKGQQPLSAAYGQTASPAHRADSPDGTIAAGAQVSPVEDGHGAAAIERLIMELVVRHGEEVIYKDVETEDGQTTDLSVAQYVLYDLEADDLQFSNSLYNQMLHEAADHSADEGFKAEPFFTRHPDIAVSSEATLLATDRYQLSKSLQMEHQEDTLRAKVIHLILDFRMNYVENRLHELRRELSAAGDTRQMMEVMERIRDMQVMRNAIAKKLGNDIVA